MKAPPQPSAWKHNSRGFELDWREPTAPELRGLAATASAELDAASQRIQWQFKVTAPKDTWTLWRVIFPQIGLAPLGHDAVVFFPRGPGEEQRDVWSRKFNYQGHYPGGWCSMQFMAAYRTGERATGLYAALHDPWGSVKDLALESNPAVHRVRLAYDLPIPDMGEPGKNFELSGRAVWQLLRGDWFDAASIYKDWARKEARWWPQLGERGRNDSPEWMRDLSVWAMSGGSPEECVPRVLAMERELSLPIGFHWYRWHEIPFDNDYPHYFPARAGFREAVSGLQKSNVFVMPYINGRLWDSHDRSADDFEFTAKALPAVSKREDGQPHLESYGSKETNGNGRGNGRLHPRQC